MSIGRLLLATRDQLREKMELLPEECNVMPGPEPPPSCGQKFISVYGSSWSASGDDIYQDQGIYETYDIVCAATFRSSYVPFDLLGEELYVKRMLGIEDFCRRIIGYVHNSTAINGKVNDMLLTDFETSDKSPHAMVEYLRWVSTDPNPLPVTGTWFNSDDSSSSGLVMECRFNQATRFSSFQVSDSLDNYS